MFAYPIRTFVAVVPMQMMTATTVKAFPHLLLNTASISVSAKFTNPIKLYRKFLKLIICDQKIQSNFALISMPSPFNITLSLLILLKQFYLDIFKIIHAKIMCSIYIGIL